MCTVLAIKLLDIPDESRYSLSFSSYHAKWHLFFIYPLGYCIVSKEKKQKRKEKKRKEKKRKEKKRKDDTVRQFYIAKLEVYPSFPMAVRPS